jgi:hypothetical protein
MASEIPASTVVQEHASVMRTKVFGLAQAIEAKAVFPFGMPALAFAIASMAACFGVILVELYLGLKPYSLGLNPHVQAVVMWGLGLMAVHALWQDRKRHHNNIPVALGAIAVATLIATLYIRYFIEIEILSYVLLVLAAFLNLTIFMAEPHGSTAIARDPPLESGPRGQSRKSGPRD